MLYFFIFAVILGGGYVMAARMYGQKQEDAEAFYWANLKTPLYFIQESPFDTSVAERHANALDNLEKYGNKFLKSSDVRLMLYDIHFNILSDVASIQMNHSKFWDLAVRESAQHKAEWINEKAGYIGGTAAAVFANQVKNN